VFRPPFFKRSAGGADSEIQNAGKGKKIFRKKGERREGYHREGRNTEERKNIRSILALFQIGSARPISRQWWGMPLFFRSVILTSQQKGGGLEEGEGIKRGKNNQEDAFAHINSPNDESGNERYGATETPSLGGV